VADGERLIVLGSNVADVLFPQGDPLGQTVRIRTRPFRVIGLIKRKGAFAGGFQQDDVVVIPISAFFQLWGKARSLNISMQAASTELLPRAMEEVRNLMRRRHNLKPTQEDDFYIFSNESATQAFNQIAPATTRRQLRGLPPLPHRGGIGILNIMLVSVTERTAGIRCPQGAGSAAARISVSSPPRRWCSRSSAASWGSWWAPSSPSSGDGRSAHRGAGLGSGAGDVDELWGWADLRDLPRGAPHAPRDPVDAMRAGSLLARLDGLHAGVACEAQEAADVAWGRFPAVAAAWRASCWSESRCRRMVSGTMNAGR
jgi:hypothetical protein